MNEHRVEVAEFCRTKGCVFCASQVGPFVDRDVEDRDGDRLYECLSCVRLGARELGLTRGKRETELINADKLLRAKDDEVRETAERNQQLTDSNALLVAENTQLAADLSRANQRNEQLADRLRGDAASTLDLVGS